MFAMEMVVSQLPLSWTCNAVGLKMIDQRIQGTWDDDCQNVLKTHIQIILHRIATTGSLGSGNVYKLRTATMILHFQNRPWEPWCDWGIVLAIAMLGKFPRLC